MTELPAQTLAEVSNAWKSGTLVSKGEGRARPLPSIWAKNATNATIGSNRPVSITGFSTSLTYDAAYKKMLAGSLALSVSDASSAAVVTQESIAAGKFGRVSGQIDFGVVYFTNTSHGYATSDFSSAESGQFRIVARSGYSGSYAVCALLSNSEGGGGSYIAGEGVVFDGNTIVNNGIRGAFIGNRSTEMIRHTDLGFNPKYFKWIDATDTIGGKLVSVKTKSLLVVTNITNGVPVREIIRVFED